MASSTHFPFPTFVLIATIIWISSSSASTQAINVKFQSGREGRGRGGSRSLLSFKETPKGGNVSFDCSPSGPCVACVYSEKNDEKYRCSETGYRIPLKCEEAEKGVKEESGKKLEKSRSTLENTYSHAKTHGIPQESEEVSSTILHRRLGDRSSTMEGGRQSYITYRSCIPSVNEEKLSVLGFEVIMFFLLLVSAPVIYLRRKQTVTMSGVGAVRVQTNSRY